MDAMKNIRNFNEFKEESLNERLFIKEFGRLNEEALWAAIKNLFSKIFGKIDKTLADAVSNFTKKLDGSKSWEESVKYFNEALTIETKNMEESLKTMTGPLGLRKVLGDNASIIFIQWLEMKNKYGLDTCAPKVIFQNNPMFQFDNTTDFNKNIANAAGAVIMELNGKTQPPPFDPNTLKDTYAKSTDIHQVQQADQPPQQPPQQPQQQQQQQQQPPQQPQQSGHSADNSTHDNYTYKGKNILNEEVENSTNTNQNTSANTNTNQNTSAANPTTPTNQQPFDKLKEEVNKYIKENYYVYSSNKIKQIKAPAKIGSEDAVYALAKNSQATQIPQSLAKLLNSIINVKDKQTLMNIRDAVAKSLGKNPEDMKNEMPL